MTTKRNCINCHFLGPTDKGITLNRNARKVLEINLNEWFDAKKYKECILGCQCQFWSEVSLMNESIARWRELGTVEEDKKTSDYMTNPELRKVHLEEVLYTERGDTCFWYEHKEGMDIGTATILERRRWGTKEAEEDRALTREALQQSKRSNYIAILVAFITAAALVHNALGLDGMFFILSVILGVLIAYGISKMRLKREEVNKSSG